MSELFYCTRKKNKPQKQCAQIKWIAGYKSAMKPEEKNNQLNPCYYHLKKVNCPQKDKNNE